MVMADVQLQQVLEQRIRKFSESSDFVMGEVDIPQFGHVQGWDIA